MKDVQDLTLGFRDAENYRRRENKELHNTLFIRTPELENLRDHGKYFLVGEKGTGKTAFAVYLANNEYHNIRASHRYIRETDYDKFLELKQQNSLTLSDYTNIWKVIIYLLLAENIIQREGGDSFLASFVRLRELKAAIDEYYNSAFSPEIIYAINMIEESQRAAEIFSKHAKASAGRKTKTDFSSSRFQTNLMYIQRQFEEALGSIKLTRDYLLFIDGIDIRPDKIPYPDYLDCIKGLANAVWAVDNDFFSNIRDSKGRIRCVLLVRPDIFDSLNLQNTNAKVKDNSVVLNWLTTYPGHRKSVLFELADRLLAYDQGSECVEAGMAWDYYFPFNATNVRTQFSTYSSFIALLRVSLYRPRDVLTVLSILQENLIQAGDARSRVFREEDFNDPSFTRKYSDYLLGEVKDHLSFYYKPNDYELFLKFFQYLNGRSRFTYDEYLKAYKDYDKFLSDQSVPRPEFCSSPDDMLQFLYELNVLAYVLDTERDGTFFGYCFRERSPSNLSPKVRTHVRYDIHYGLMKALDLGKKFKGSRIGIGS